VTCDVSGCTCTNSCYKGCYATACQNVDCAKGIGPPSSSAFAQSGGNQTASSSAISVEDGYSMSHEQHAAIAADNPVVGIVLGARGSKRPNGMILYSGPFNGSRSNHDWQGAVTSAYRFYGNVVIASQNDLVVDIAFEDIVRPDIPYSPAPPAVRVVTNRSRSATVLPLTGEQQAALDRVFAALGNPHKIRSQ
jgi:hypothetical protein